MRVVRERGFAFFHSVAGVQVMLHASDCVDYNGYRSPMFETLQLGTWVTGELIPNPRHQDTLRAIRVELAYSDEEVTR